MRRSILAIASAFVLAPTGPLLAQRPLSVGLAGGVSVPQGELRDGATTGWHALATVSLSTLMQPLGLRLDIAYNRFDFSDARSDCSCAFSAAGGPGHQTVGSATLNATYRLPRTDSPLSPYLITGIGAYRTECSLGSGCSAVTRYGWNAGLGTKLTGLGLRTFVEARFHSVVEPGPDLHFFPVTLGLLF